MVGLIRSGALRRSGSAAKERFVAAAIEPVAAELVLELGANDGHSPARGEGRPASVVAVDSTISRRSPLSRHSARGRHPCAPLVLDLSDRRRVSAAVEGALPFVERVRPDLVWCLAVVHHLALTNTCPLEEIVAFLASSGPAVVEFPPTTT